MYLHVYWGFERSLDGAIAPLLELSAGRHKIIRSAGMPNETLRDRIVVRLALDAMTFRP